MFGNPQTSCAGFNAPGFNAPTGFGADLVPSTVAAPGPPQYFTPPPVVIGYVAPVAPGGPVGATIGIVEAITPPGVTTPLQALLPGLFPTVPPPPPEMPTLTLPPVEDIFPPDYALPTPTLPPIQTLEPVLPPEEPTITVTATSGAVPPPGGGSPVALAPELPPNWWDLSQFKLPWQQPGLLQDILDTVEAYGQRVPIPWWTFIKQLLGVPSSDPFFGYPAITVHDPGLLPAPELAPIAVPQPGIPGVAPAGDPIAVPAPGVSPRRVPAPTPRPRPGTTAVPSPAPFPGPLPVAAPFPTPQPNPVVVLPPQLPQPPPGYNRPPAIAGPPPGLSPIRPPTLTPASVDPATEAAARAKRCEQNAQKAKSPSNQRRKKRKKTCACVHSRSK